MAAGPGAAEMANIPFLAFFLANASRGRPRRGARSAREDRPPLSQTPSTGASCAGIAASSQTRAAACAPTVESRAPDSTRWTPPTMTPDVPGTTQPSLATPGRRIHRRLRVAARTLLALLLGGALILAGVMLVRNGLVPLVDALFHPGPAWLSAIRRAGIFVAALAGYWAYVRSFERRAVTELRVRPLPLLLGGAGGVLMIGLPMAALFALGAYEVAQVPGLSSALWGVAALIVIAAMLEELVYRALLFRVLERALGTVPALALQAVMFALVHLENLPHPGAAIVAPMLLSVTVLGLLWAGLFVLTRNLWVGVAHHAAWNFTILLGGVPLSGIDDWRTLTPLASRVTGPGWLTGGSFGPESSWLVIATTSLATAWLLRVAYRRGLFRRPGIDE